MIANGIDFDENGVPYTVVRPITTPQRMTHLLKCALSTPYTPLKDVNGEYLPGEKEFEGLSLGEVGAMRSARAYAAGEIEAARFVNDRILGKPKQQVENLNVNVSFKEFLAQLEVDDKSQAITVHVSPVHALPAIPMSVLDDV